MRSKQIFADGGEFVEVSRQNVGQQLDAERSARNVGETYADRLGFHFGVAVEQAADFREHEADMVRLALGAQAESCLEKNLVAAAEVLQIDRRHGAVGNRQQSPLFGANACGAQADVFDDSGAIAEAADIADAKHFVAEHGDAAEKILDGLLRAEADGQAADAESGERGAHVEAQAAEHRENARRRK